MKSYVLLPVVSKILEYVDKHSMNIFLVHTLIFEYYFQEQIYSLKHWGIILFVVFIISLSVSIVIE